MGLSDNSITIRVAQAIGIYGSTLLTGFLGSLSFVTCTSLALAPAETQLRQYQCMGALGVRTAAPLALGQGLLHGLLAWHASKLGDTHSSRLYLTAAVLIPSMIPFSIVFIQTTNDKLNELALRSKNSSSAVDVREVKNLMADWKSLNYVRTGIVALGGMMGLVGTFS